MGKHISSTLRKCILNEKKLIFFRVNITAGPSEERPLITGLHVVADIYCNVCQTILGWKYV